MLQIDIPGQELFDEQNQTFLIVKPHTLQLEHSLVSISKWEAKWCKAFFSRKEKTEEETIDYIRCMTLTQNVDKNVYRCLTRENVKQIEEYISAPMTATVFSDHQGRSSSETTTSELLYYYMIALNIPFECQKWHLNRLITLIRVCSIKNQPGKKMSRGEIMQRNSALNAARRKQYHSNG